MRQWVMTVLQKHQMCVSLWTSSSSVLAYFTLACSVSLCIAALLGEHLWLRSWWHCVKVCLCPRLLPLCSAVLHSTSSLSSLQLLVRSHCSAGVCLQLSAAHTLARAHKEPPRSFRDRAPSSLSVKPRNRNTSRNWRVSPRYTFFRWGSVV